jgi:hypothetical protein
MEATMSLIAPAAPPGFKWVLVCEHCKYCFCFECLVCQIKSSPACVHILEAWNDKFYGFESFGGYFREKINLFQGIMSGGPYQGQVYYGLYTPYITYTDYCMIMNQVKYDGNAWITFECDSFKEFYYSWSRWLYLLMWQYCPRDIDFFNQTDNEAFKIWFHAKVCEAAQHEAWFVFSLSFQTSTLKLLPSRPGDLPCYKIHSSFYGNTCIPPDELIPQMKGSPFYESFSCLPPFSSDSSSPPPSHEYDNDFSFDSVAEHNLDNYMEA